MTEIDHEGAVRLLADVVILDEKAQAAEARVGQARAKVAKLEDQVAEADAAVATAVTDVDAAQARLAGAVDAAQVIPDELLDRAADVVAHSRRIRQATIDALAAAKAAGRAGDGATRAAVLDQLAGLGAMARAETATIAGAAGDATTEQED